MTENLRLNVSLLRRRVPNLTTASKEVGLRPATVSNLCTGKISVGRAEVRTLVALANLAQCTLDELIIQGHKQKMIETGIKVIDLLSPIVEGGTVGFVARQKLGQLVTLAEIVSRLGKKGYQSILMVPEKKLSSLDDLDQYVDFVGSSVDEIYTKIEGIERKDEVLLLVERGFMLSGELYDLKERFTLKGFPDMTTILFDPTGEVVDEANPYGPLDTLCHFDLDMALRKLYPAIHPLLSTSTVLEDNLLEEEHMKTQRRTKKLLRKYGEIRVLANSIGFEKIPSSDMEIYKRGQLVEAYFTQPYYVAEPFTKTPGVTVPLKTTIQDVTKLLDVSIEGLNVDDLYFKGAL